MLTKKRSRLSRNSASLMSFNPAWLLPLLALLMVLTSFGCAVQIPNTRFCAVAGVEEAGMDCFHTLSDEEETIPPGKIKDFLEARPEIKDSKGKVIQEAHGAAICQPMEDWGAEHTALEQACQKLGAACTYEIKQLIDNVTKKVNAEQSPVVVQ